MSDDIVKTLLDRKGRLANQIRAFGEETEKRADGWSAEDKQKWDRLNKEYDAVSERADELHKAQVAQAEMDGQRADYENVVRSQPAPRPDPNRPTAEETEKRLRDWLTGEDPQAHRHTVRHPGSGSQRLPNRSPRPIHRFSGSGWDHSPAFIRGRSLLAVPRRLRSQTGRRGVIVTDGGQPHVMPKVASHGTATLWRRNRLKRSRPDVRHHRARSVQVRPTHRSNHRANQ